jgi:hypothetical protein
MVTEQNIQEFQEQAQKKSLSILLFGLGLVICLAVFIWPVSREYVTNLANGSWLGLLVIGLLYAISFTSAFATGMIISVASSYPPILIALIGGLGALIYDLIIFLFIKKASHQGFFSELKKKYLNRSSVSWFLIVLGAIVIASPLPDELGSGLFGSSKLKPKYFIPISFVLNAFGIFVIALIAK